MEKYMFEYPISGRVEINFSQNEYLLCKEGKADAMEMAFEKCDVCEAQLEKIDNPVWEQNNDGFDESNQVQLSCDVNAKYVVTTLGESLNECHSYASESVISADFGMLKYSEIDDPVITEQKLNSDILLETVNAELYRGKHGQEMADNITAVNMDETQKTVVIKPKDAVDETVDIEVYSCGILEYDEIHRNFPPNFDVNDLRLLKSDVKYEDLIDLIPNIQLAIDKDSNFEVSR